MKNLLIFIIPGVPGSVHRHLDALAVDRGLDGACVQGNRQVETLPSPGPSNKPEIRALLGLHENTLPCLSVDFYGIY